MNYQLYFFATAILGLILSAINIALYYQQKRISDELSMIKEHQKSLLQKSVKQKQLLGTRASQIKRRDDKIAKLKAEIKEIDIKVPIR
jgi:hypothetical protein